MIASQVLTHLSPVQAAMLRDSLGGAAGRYVEQVEISFAATVPAEKIISAWEATVAATEALGVCFVVENGEPCGLTAVSPMAALRIEREIPANWDVWLSEDRGHGIPLTGAVPWRAAYWPAGRKLIWTFHHALLDGRSIAKILKSFQIRLKGDGEPVILKLIPWMPVSSETISKANVYYQNALAGVESRIPEYPLDDATSRVFLSKTLGSDLSAGIEITARNMEVTAATLVTWAWGQAVASASGTQTALIGQVQSGAPADQQAGFAMNTLPLVVSRGSHSTVSSAVQKLRLDMLEIRGFGNIFPEDLPSQIFRETGGPWPGGILMVERGRMHHQVGNSDDIESLVLHERSGETLIAIAYLHPDLTLEVETDGQTYGNLATANLLDHWAEIITALALARSDDVAVISRQSRSINEKLDAWENGGPPLANTHLNQAWREACRNHSSSCAIWTPDFQLTYAELDARIAELAARLHEVGVIHGSIVACRHSSRNHLLLSLLAIARVGAIYVPLDPVLPFSRQLEILEDSGANLILTDDCASCAAFGKQMIEINGNASPMIPAEIPFRPSDVLALMYTSGSTGKPKGVIMTHGGVINEALSIAKILGLTQGDRLLQFSSPGFDASLEELLSPLFSGATLVPRPDDISSDLSLFHRFLQTAEIQALDLTTAFWAAWCAWMVAEGERVPRSLRTAVIGGERLSAAAARDWMAAGGSHLQLVNSYGPTEASIAATFHEVTAATLNADDPPIGKPLPGVSVRVADDSGARMPPGAAGELWLGGHCVSPGYWNQPDLTAAKFQEIDGQKWYRTGDRAHWDTTGCLRFLGRSDDQLKIRGHRVEPGEVIRLMESYPGVSAAYVGPITHDGNTLLAAWVRWNGVAPVDWPALLAAHIGRHLSAAFIPSKWAAVDHFTLTERGKMDRMALPEPTLTAGGSANFQTPETPTEMRIAEMWSELLGVTEIGRDDSFFDLGGHSLAALRLFAGIAREWKIRIPVASLIAAPTPRLLAETILKQTDSSQASVSPGPVIVPIRAKGHKHPLFCIHGGDGGVIFYRDVANHLRNDRPLLAMECPALGADEEVKVISVEATAESYINVLRDHQPTGPYYLAGYSYGGLLAYEMARQLRQAGEDVAFVGLFDTVNPAIPIREYTLLERAEVYWTSQQGQHWFDRLSLVFGRICEGLQTHFRVKSEIRAARNASTTAPHSEIRMLQVREAHWVSMTLYQPQPLDCHITIFKTVSADDKFEIPRDYGWTALVKSLEIVEVPGQHLTMFAPRYASNLAKEISLRI
ncbi:MAG: amino acid adenylation domain-containing protein [Gloeobacteraceae cyanobacterium ES-bin-144]|nr:amino acid adenylation domain-containing protein [Verrucomicrobiales bacterium]